MKLINFCFVTDCNDVVVGDLNDELIGCMMGDYGSVVDNVNGDVEESFNDIWEESFGGNNDWFNDEDLKKFDDGKEMFWEKVKEMGVGGKFYVWGVEYDRNICYVIE